MPRGVQRARRDAERTLRDVQRTGQAARTG